MTTGVNFYDQLQENAGHDYSAYFDPARTNDIIKQAFVKLGEVEYANITAQEPTDEMAHLIKTNVPLTLSSNVISLSAIPNYLHLLALKTNFSIPIGARVIGASNSKPIVLSLDKITNLRDKDFVNITGVVGNTAANGKRYIKQLFDDFNNNNFTSQLYVDENLVLPTTGNAAYASGGTVSRIVSQWAKKKSSYRKNSNFGTPTENDPYWEIQDGKLQILPINKSCPTADLDYLQLPAVYPDVLNGVIDLELTFSLRILYRWMDEAAKLMGLYSRDPELTQDSQEEIVQP